MMYRLLAINVDGTLLKTNRRLARATKEAIQYVKDKEVIVTLVTSRNFLSAKKVAKALKIDTPIITHQGAFIGSSIDDPIYESRISEDKTFNLVQVLENFDCNVRLLHEKFSLGNRVRITDNILSKAVLGTSDPLFYPMQFVESLSDQLRDYPMAPPKIDVYFSEHDELQKVKDTLEAFDDIRTIEKNDKMLEIVPSQVSKAKGLQLLGEHFDIPLEKMVAIGDDYDDIEMIEKVGLGVAMGSAPNEVKKAADWITRSNDQNGVSYMVKEHFRKQLRVKFMKEINKN